MTATVERLIVHTVDVPLVRPFITAVRRTDAISLGDRARAHDLDAGLWLNGSPVDSGPHSTADSVVLSRAAGTGITGLCASGGRP